MRIYKKIILLANIGFSFALAACIPFEGTIDEVKVKAKGGRVPAVVNTSCTVTFHLNGGTGKVPDTVTVERGAVIALPSESGFAKGNFTFGGWNTKTDGAGDNFDADSLFPVSGTVTLYAKWNSTFTVTFNANGATSGLAPVSMSQASGSVIQIPDAGDLAKTYYVFGGWNTLASGKGVHLPSGDSYTVTGNITLYAQWNPLCIVTFLPNTGLGQAPDPVEAGLGTSINLPGGGELTKENHSFAGWNPQANGSGITYLAGRPFEVTASSITLYAIWSNIYTVIFDVNKGSGSVPSQTVLTDSSVTIPSGDGLSRDGYAFDGWDTQADGLGTKIPGPYYMPNANTTLFARWMSTVTFSANDGSGTPPVVAPVPDGSPITIPAGTGLSRSGMVFNGWNSNAAGTGTSYAVDSSFTPKGNTTLYAKWCYTVTFNANNGTPVPAQQLVISGGKVAYPATMARSGYNSYNRDEWYKESGLATKWVFSSGTVSANMTLYYRWTSTVSYDLDGGSGTKPANQTVTAGSSVTLPAQGSITKRGHGFGGWAASQGGTALSSPYTPTGNITLYAKWNKITDVTDAVAGTGLDNKFLWLYNNALSSTTYTVAATANETLAAAVNSTANRRNMNYGSSYTSVIINLSGSGGERIITLSGTGTLFTVNSGITLSLGSNITLKGNNANITSVVTVNTGGKFIMNAGSKITGNTNTTTTTGGFGGAVRVYGGQFTMNNGEISGNTALGGGGVYVYTGGSFYLYGGKISGNTVSGNGGGVETEGYFYMGNAEISSNHSGNMGGGVNVYSGTFVFGGDNMKITKNSAYTYGGGLYVRSGASAEMGNGELSGNKAGERGGGVFVSSTGKFIKSTGGTIPGYGSYTGSNESSFNSVRGPSNNIPMSGQGHGVYASTSNSSKRKETTAGANVTLTYDGTVTPALISGSWDY